MDHILLVLLLGSVAWWIWYLWSNDWATEAISAKLTAIAQFLASHGHVLSTYVPYDGAPCQVEYGLVGYPEGLMSSWKFYRLLRRAFTRNDVSELVEACKAAHDKAVDRQIRQRSL